MNAMASQITGVSIVFSTVRSGAHQRKMQSYVSLAFVMGIHRWLVDSPNKGPVTRKMFPFDAMTPTRQALLSGRCSRITGQVVQQAVEVVRLGPLNCTAGCSCKQGFLNLAKMHVKTPLKFWFHMLFTKDYGYVIVY